MPTSAPPAIIGVCLRFIPGYRRYKCWRAAPRLRKSPSQNAAASTRNSSAACRNCLLSSPTSNSKTFALHRAIALTRHRRRWRLPVKSEDYLTGVVHRGGLSAALLGLSGDASFEIVATSAGGERRVAIDLSEMGSITRSLGAVVSFINGKLAAAGAASRLEAVDQTPKTTTIVIAGQPKEIRYTGLKQYALKVDVRAGERVAFEADAPQPAFYALGQAGNGARLIKLEDVGGAAGLPALLARPGRYSRSAGRACRDRLVRARRALQHSARRRLRAAHQHLDVGWRQQFRDCAACARRGCAATALR